MNRIQVALLLMLTGLVQACSTNLPSHSRAEVRAELDGALAFDDVDIEAILDKKPQLQAPFRLAVAPPLGSNRSTRRFGTLLQPTWSAEEEALIQRWGEEAKGRGLISELVFLPHALLRPDWQEEPGSSMLKALRGAAARQQADAVMLLHSVAGIEESINALAILDLTIIAAFFVPGHEFDAHCAMEALVFDVRNEYLYLTLRSEATASGATTALNGLRFAKGKMAESRVKALEAIGEPLLQAALSMGAAQK